MVNQVTVANLSSFPWLQSHWNQLANAYKCDYLTHAYLFYSQQELGVSEWLQQLATYLLCHYPTSLDEACGECQNCYLRQSRSHPDCHIIGEENGAMIKVDTIRWVQEQVYQTYQIGPYQIFIITKAHRLNQAASNALLKILEEPPSHTLFFLESQYMHSLLPTVISRCQVIQCLPPSEATLKDWVYQLGYYKDDVDWSLLCGLSRYSPVSLVNLLKGDWLNRRQQWFEAFYNFSLGKQPLAATIDALEVQRLDDYLSWLYFGIQDILKLQQNVQGCCIMNYDYKRYLNTLKSQISTESLLNFVDLLQRYWQYLQLSYNINTQLALENILLVWQSNMQQ